jgi:hypothetical protein
LARPLNTTDTDHRLLRLAEGDNVLIVTAPVAAGETLLLGGVTVLSATDLALGFKVAGADLEAGTVAVRFGMPIGRITASVACGQLVHTHNLQSLYMRTHARGEQ